MEGNRMIPSKYALDGPDSKNAEEPIIKSSRIIGQESITEDSEEYMKILELSRDIQRILNWMEDYLTIILVGLLMYGVLMMGVYFVFTKKIQSVQLVEIPPVQIIHHETEENEDNNSHKSDTIPVSLHKNPLSTRLRPSDKLDTSIPNLELDISRNSIEEEDIRKISDVSVFTHNNMTGCLEVDNKSRNQKMSPDIDQITKFKFSNYPSFAQQLKQKKKINDLNSSPIIEENSNSLSPTASFKRSRLPFATKKEENLKEDYYSQGENIIVEETQRKVTTYRNTHTLRKLISDELNGRDPKMSFVEESKKSISFTKKNERKLIPESENNDYTDDSFMKIKFMKNEQTKDSPSMNYYQNLRSRTYKEDGEELFNFTAVDEKKSWNKREFNFESNTSHDLKKKNILKNNSESKPSRASDCQALALIDHKDNTNNTDTTPQKLIARVFISKKVDYINNEREDNMIVQNPEDIAKEEKLKELIQKSSSEETKIIQNDSMRYWGSIQTNQKFGPVEIKNLENGKVTEISSQEEEEESFEFSNEGKSEDAHSQRNKGGNIFVKGPSGELS